MSQARAAKIAAGILTALLALHAPAEATEPPAPSQPPATLLLSVTDMMWCVYTDYAHDTAYYSDLFSPARQAVASYAAPFSAYLVQVHPELTDVQDGTECLEAKGTPSDVRRAWETHKAARLLENLRLVETSWKGSV